MQRLLDQLVACVACALEERRHFVTERGNTHDLSTLMQQKLNHLRKQQQELVQRLDKRNQTQLTLCLFLYTANVNALWPFLFTAFTSAFISISRSSPRRDFSFSASGEQHAMHNSWLPCSISMFASNAFVFSSVCAASAGQPARMSHCICLALTTRPWLASS